MALLDLPPIPPSLKPLSQYLQRAEELKLQDPIISYWCAYYAAQVGIGLRAKDTASRTFLLSLLDVLERMKSEFGSDDAIHDENVASAYVENFALKVFNVADNEDRAGKATRGTAKKFLAAANFLEVLTVFASPSSDTSVAAESTNAEKIRYAKWKAVDIAKAYREGRKPTPGPAEAVEEFLPSASEEAAEPAIPATPSTPPHTLPSRSSGSPPAIVRGTPPPPQLTDMPVTGLATPPRPRDHLLPESAPFVTDPKSPGSWSTIATPGTPDRRFEEDSTPFRKTAWVADDIEDQEGGPSASSPGVGVGGRGISPPLSASSTESAERKVRFSPSVTGGSAVSTPSALTQSTEEENPFDVRVVINPPEANVPNAPPSAPFSSLPRGFVPTSIHPSSPPAAAAPSPTHYIPSTIPNVPPLRHHGAQSTQSTVTMTPVELTPLVISKTQKHCRFAISALDYEDAETARKELRAALALLGG